MPQNQEGRQRNVRHETGSQIQDLQMPHRMEEVRQQGHRQI